MRPETEGRLQSLYRHRRLVSLSAYAVVSAFSYALAYFLRFEFAFPAVAVELFSQSIVALLAARLVTHMLLGLTAGRWRFAGTSDVIRLAISVALGSVAFYMLTVAAGVVGPVPRSVIMIEFFLTTYFTAALWIAYRIGFERLRRLRSGAAVSRRVLIVGAGEAGSLLAREMSRLPTSYRPVGFIDDDPDKWHTTVHGVRVLGSTEQLASVALATHAAEIIIAMPSAPPADLWRVVEHCEATKLKFKVLPGISDVLHGQVRVNQLRELRIEDLLGREPIDLQLPQLAQDIEGQPVLITGAAGSIGSELSRQLALHNPAMLILFDQSETGLFYLELELREKHPHLNLVPIIGDIVDGTSVERLFRRFRPTRVYHAAAYKHVPVMQVNVREALRNNSLGTWMVGEAAGRYGAEKFVLVSTDKAVRPTSVMGATKRLAEVAVLALQHRFPQTGYAAVRFGNVLGSSGSVIPIFKEQIETGRPLTVTHPEATRYFMTIPEAVQLILHASLLPEMRGRIAMLEMGEPVRIVDLARNLLRLSGAHGNGTRVVFTGLRSGEKLHEELVGPDESTTPTPIPKVRLIAPSDFVLGNIDQVLEEWESWFAADLDSDVLGSLAGFFPDLQVQEPEQVIATVPFQTAAQSPAPAASSY